MTAQSATTPDNAAGGRARCAAMLSANAPASFALTARLPTRRQAFAEAG